MGFPDDIVFRIETRGWGEDNTTATNEEILSLEAVSSSRMGGVDAGGVNTDRLLSLKFFVCSQVELLIEKGGSVGRIDGCEIMF